MAQFDIVRLAGGELAIDCQSDLLRDIATRFVVPLRKMPDAPPRRERLNPIFTVGDAEWVMVTQFASAVRCEQIDATIGSLGNDYLRVTAALDMLISGF
ncbi:CcdB family protein [Stakelama saccharophila]|uniref:Toxin CcdB n=1 Tax=Stakelama saccharophila TaxID=3075605 RepID=A0ABZ0B981_9SPHN|nr:CcdB family protein [Stakelama sp. W311]WNO53838.1 CcdB family protein [Stakelama sp. W311]